jgi:hypothetical protein
MVRAACRAPLLPVLPRGTLPAWGRCLDRAAAPVAPDHQTARAWNLDTCLECLGSFRSFGCCLVLRARARARYARALDRAARVRALTRRRVLPRRAPSWTAACR